MVSAAAVAENEVEDYWEQQHLEVAGMYMDVVVAVAVAVAVSVAELEEQAEENENGSKEC